MIFTLKYLVIPFLKQRLLTALLVQKARKEGMERKTAAVSKFQSKALTKEKIERILLNNITLMEQL